MVFAILKDPRFLCSNLISKLCNLAQASLSLSFFYFYFYFSCVNPTNLILLHSVFASIGLLTFSYLFCVFVHIVITGKLLKPESSDKTPENVDGSNKTILDC